MNQDELKESQEAINKIDHNVKFIIEHESDQICKLCNKKVSSFCKSHSVPDKVLNHMNIDNAKFIPFYNAVRKNIMTNVSKGKGNCGIFKLICRPCDQKYFSDLDNFDIINGIWNNKLLKLQAQRINLYQMYRLKEFSYTLYKIYDKIMTEDQIKSLKKGVSCEIDEFNKFFKKYENENINFNILFDTVLDYEVNFSTVCVVPMIFNPSLDFMVKNVRTDNLKIESHQIDNEKFVNMINMGINENNYMYIVVFPCDGKTRVTLFCDEESISNIFVKADFDYFSTDKILLYISSTLVLFGKNMYGNQSFMKTFREGSKIFTKQFFRKYNGCGFPPNSTTDIIESYLYLYSNNINLFKI